MNSRIKLTLLILIPVWIIAGLTQPAAAANFSGADVIAAVNNLRASQGLAPYSVDSSLMSYAQEHSEYQASINASTHQHSDGSYPGDRGVIENIASGSSDYLTAEGVVSQIWTDALHTQTMTGYSSGSVGAGVASSGGTTYVTLVVRAGGRAPAQSPASQPTSEAGSGDGAGSGTQAQATQPPDSSPPTVGLQTSTPNPDGSVIHTVGAGESLWSIAIAYGVTINEIRALNGLPPDSVSIFEGQDLIIRQGQPVTATPEEGDTQEGTPAPTNTPRPTQPPRTSTPTTPPTLTSTPAPTPTPTTAPFNPASLLPDRQTLAIALIVIGLGGVVLVLVFGFRK